MGSTKMKFKYILLAMFLFLLAGAFVYYNKRDLGLRSGAQTYTFAPLEKNQAALVRFRSESLQPFSPFIITFEDILDNHYSSLVQKKEELLLASALEQFALKAKNITVGAAPFARPLRQICNQYGFRCPQMQKVKFFGPQNYFLQVDEQVVYREQVKVDSVAFKAAMSEVLDYLISKINKKIQARLLYLLAKENNMTAQEYVDQKILKEEELQTWAKVASTSYSRSEEEQKAYASLLYQQHKDRTITDYLFKSYVQVPVVVNIQQPQFNFVARWDWTPFFGIAPRKNSLHVTLFYDFFSQASRETLKMLLSFKDKKIDFTVGLHPVFAENDRMQFFLTEYLFCAWMKNPEDFWKLLKGLSENFTPQTPQNSEEQTDKLMASLGIDSSSLKKCAIARETKDVVDYHLKTAQYLRLNSLPALFIGNEVHLGPITQVEFEQILSRQ